MANQETNQRTHQRRHLFYYLNVEDRSTGKSIGRVVDITVAGVLVISDNKYKDGEQIKARIMLDDDLLEQAHGNLEVDLLCRWSKPDINPDYSVSGFAFENLSDNDVRLIERVIDTIGFRD